jgi:large subunit ribosomal protein L13
MNRHRKTFSAKEAEARAQAAWWVVDATDQPLGRLATLIAIKLRGKDKPTYTPHVDTGDFVVVVNASKAKLTGNKSDDKNYYEHSGYPGGIRTIPYQEMLKRRPDAPIRLAVRGMLPKNVLGRAQLKKLKIYAGADHPHAAQSPKALTR